MADLKGTTTVPDDTRVNSMNVVSVEMADLSEKDKNNVELELQREIEEVMVEKWKQMLFLQKTRSGVVKKGDTARASKMVNTPFSLKDLVQMIDVSISSKYGADLEGMTRALVDSLHGPFKSFKLEKKREAEEGLSRRIRAAVQQVLGEAKGKNEVKIIVVGPAMSNAGMMTSQIPHQAAGGMGGQGCVVNPNLQKPYYQVQSYSPGAQPVLDSYFPRPSPMPVLEGNVYPGMSENVRDQVARTLREFGLEPKGRIRTYNKPYPDFFDTIPYPRGFRVPDFVKFTWEDSKTTYEHVGRFLAQVSDFGTTDVHKIRRFHLSLSGMTFN
jgi:hypothetical protein